MELTIRLRAVHLSPLGFNVISDLCIHTYLPSPLCVSGPVLGLKLQGCLMSSPTSGELRVWWARQPRSRRITRKHVECLSRVTHSSCVACLPCGTVGCRKVTVERKHFSWGRAVLFCWPKRSSTQRGYVGGPQRHMELGTKTEICSSCPRSLIRNQTNMILNAPSGVCTWWLDCDDRS